MHRGTTGISRLAKAAVGPLDFRAGSRIEWCVVAGARNPDEAFLADERLLPEVSRDETDKASNGGASGDARFAASGWHENLDDHDELS